LSKDKALVNDYFMNWMVFVVSGFHNDHKTMSEHLITGSKV